MADTVASKTKCLGWYTMIVKIYVDVCPEHVQSKLAERLYEDLTQSEKNFVRVHDLIWDYMTPCERMCLLLSHVGWEKSLHRHSGDLD